MEQLLSIWADLTPIARGLLLVSAVFGFMCWSLWKRNIHIQDARLDDAVKTTTALADAVQAMREFKSLAGDLQRAMDRAGPCRYGQKR